jgi:hypothetical protein
MSAPPGRLAAGERLGAVAVLPTALGVALNRGLTCCWWA